jgi:RNA polymerase sigma-70 factor (ECF subfamily)
MESPRVVIPTDFRQTYGRFLPPLRAKCRRLLADHAVADDVAQEAFFRLWKSEIWKDADPRTIMAWLYRTCTRLAIDAMRERKRIDANEHVLDLLPCGSSLAASVEARAMIRRLVSTLPEDELAIAVLCRVDGLPQPEAAAVLGISERTARRMLARFDEQIASFRKELSS